MAGAVVAVAAVLIFFAGPDYAVAAERLYEISLRENSRVQGEDIYLGNIADVAAYRGAKVAPGSIDMIKALRLGSSPALGTYRLLRKKRLISRLERGGWHNALVKGPETLKIWRSSRSISKDDLILKVENNILQKMPWPKDKVELEVTFPGAEILIPEGKLKTEVELPRNYTFFGKGAVLVKLFVDGEEYKSLWAKTLIRLYTDMVLASRPILRNELIKEEDLKVERRLVASVPQGVFDDVDEIKGMRAKRKIGKDAVITQSVITLPELFKRGSMVSILLKKGGLAISAKGKAMEKGVKGKVIKVENISSKKVVLAEVLDSRTVMVGL
jgi:flagella basal body P-ring formation protein FlgA